MARRSRLHGPLILSIVAAIACGSADVAEKTGDAVTDSAGVTVQRLSADQLENAPLLELQEDLRIGSVDGPEHEQFFGIADIEPDADGWIWILDSRNSVVRVFDAEGSFIRSFGREGQGPGEFRYAGFLVVGHDTVFVGDLNFLHRFTSAGEFIDAHTVGDARTLPLAAGRMTAAGPLVAYTHRLDRPRGEPGPWYDTTSVRRLDGASATVGEPLVRFLGRETYLLGEAGFYNYPFMSATPQFGIGADGNLYSTNGDDYRIEVRAVPADTSERVTLTRIVTGDVELIPVTDAEYEANYRERLEQYEGRPAGSEGAMVREMLEKEYPSIPRASHRPVLGRILVDEAGRILVERRDLDPRPLESGDTATFDLIEPEGRIAGRVRLPPTVRVYRLTPDHLYAVVRDELDVQYVVRYRLVPALPADARTGGGTRARDGRTRHVALAAPSRAWRWSMTIRPASQLFAPRILPGLLLSVLLLPVMTPSPAAAQRGFLFREPVATFGIRAGYAIARANSDIYDFTTEQLTLDRSDFNAPVIAGDLAFRASDRFDVVLGVSYARSSRWSEFRDWIGEDDLPIEQETRLTRVPLTASARAYVLPRGRQIGRFAWIPSRVAPFVGAGVGLMWHRFEQRGEFVDINTLDIFRSIITSGGWTRTAHVFGGADLALGARFALTVDGRYTWAKAPMDGIFEDFDDIDLSGFQSSIGLLVRI